jgi:hypothetical protein
VLEDKIYDYKLFRGNLLMETFSCRPQPAIYGHHSGLWIFLGLTPLWSWEEDLHQEGGILRLLSRSEDRCGILLFSRRFDLEGFL